MNVDQARFVDHLLSLGLPATFPLLDAYSATADLLILMEKVGVTFTDTNWFRARTADNGAYVQSWFYEDFAWSGDPDANKYTRLVLRITRLDRVNGDPSSLLLVLMGTQEFLDNATGNKLYHMCSIEYEQELHPTDYKRKWFFERRDQRPRLFPTITILDENGRLPMEYATHHFRDMLQEVTHP